ncbi:MAG: 2-dehydropantoate 2-reductase [Acidimicrobiia bacterium]|nr:2-dehydropantoate 2-reductase [Acidimicrobiia bacterium]
MPRYIVFGAGAIGSVLGASLYRCGQDVVLIGRTPHVEATRRDGLQLISRGVLRRIKVSATESLRDLRPKPDDILLVTVKSHDTAQAAEELGAIYGSGTTVVSLQNAIRNEEFLANRFERVYGGLVEFGANYLSPGVVEYTRGNLLALGKFPEGVDTVAERIASDLMAAGFRVYCHPRIMRLKWWKLAFNVNNALLALLGCWLQQAQSDPETYPLMAEVMSETLLVLRKANIHPEAPPGFPPIEESIDTLRRGDFAREHDLPPDRRSYPSMWQDLKWFRKTTEADALNGEIVELGKKYGVPTPLNALLLQLAHEAVRNQQQPGKYTTQEIAKLFRQAQGG